MQIPYVDIARKHAALKEDLLAAAGRVLAHAQFVLGPEVDEFEKRFAELCGTKNAVGVASGTDALLLALRALGVGPGDEVITVPNTFVATVAAISLAGATPVFVDVGDDYNMDPSLLERAVTGRTRVILPVHLTGRPAKMDGIREIAAKHGLRVVEDAAQAVCARYRGVCAGALGDIGCFSVHPLKTLNACGDGGVMTTDDDEVCEKLRRLRNLGLESRENAVCWSDNSRLDTMQAAFLLVQLPYLEGWTAARRAHAARYRERLAELVQVRLPAEDEHEFCVYHTFVVLAERRNELKRFLATRGIGTAVHYSRPIHLQTVGETLGYERGAFPVAERQAEQILSLPVYPELEDEDIDRVADAIVAFYA